MKDLEKQIEEAAIESSNGAWNESDWTSGFINGAKSPEAKEYWFNDFIKEIIENETFLDFASKCASKKYEIGTKEHAIATISIKFGMGCSLTKEYWQQGMYSEEDMIDFGKFCKDYNSSSSTYNLHKWFKQNKKKL